MTWWVLIPLPIRRALGWLAGGVAALLAAFYTGKRRSRQETALQAAERAAKAHKTRDRIEDDIQQDDDLVRRARDAGIVRPGDK